MAAGNQTVTLLDGTPCPDTTVCNGTETCLAGVCGAGTPLDCDDTNPCTTDTCDAMLGCQHADVTDGTSCGVGMVCLGGLCL